MPQEKRPRVFVRVHFRRFITLIYDDEFPGRNAEALKHRIREYERRRRENPELPPIS